MTTVQRGGGPRSMGASLLDQVLAETLDPAYGQAARARADREEAGAAGAPSLIGLSAPCGAAVAAGRSPSTGPGGSATGASSLTRAWSGTTAGTLAAASAAGADWWPRAAASSSESRA